MGPRARPTRAVALLAALALGAALSAPAARTGSTRVGWDGCTSPPGDVRFVAADGTRLAGHRFGAGSTAIVMVHQVGGSLCQWVSYARRLAGLGFTAFPIDLRGYEDSQERHYPANQRYGGDVAAAVKDVRRRGAKRVFLLGASLGGSAVISAGANVRPQVDGVISVSGSADLVNAMAAVRRVGVPLLLLAGKYDISFAADAHRLYSAAGSRDKALKILPTTGAHGVQLVGSSAAARALIEGFIRRH